ncbi:MAG: Uncharacterized protein MSMEG_2715 [uncultured Propionibacteriaceae bacterium]|uniref:Uncharacterized protein MSMEG_2715 n=1 Tax=uncultured Propionibacteriaceae bacterium TaxID=257457 RepID=A0A6J4P7Z5_9ACTN|nr:MAG: Uncharacterized protein MSMEG_2715 [uncultured Propionibacteriaceae bacterium]
MNLDLARTVADAVLYEGYLLYPYRASSSKNQARWQFGVLGPPGAAAAGRGEESSMSMQCLLRPEPAPVTCPAPVEGPSLTVHLRFLQLQRRQLYDVQGQPIEELDVSGATWLSWDEAVEREVNLSVSWAQLRAAYSVPVDVPAGEEAEPVTDADGQTIGSVVRRRWALTARFTATAAASYGYSQLTLGVDNVCTESISNPDEAIRRSFIGAHVLVEAHGTAFVSLLEPPEEAREAAAECAQHRCWPVLTGQPGDTDLVLGSPIILYDYPEVAAQSAGALFDATEIDEILTLRVMTMTEVEKAEARATDPRSREIIDRCDAMSPAALQQLHGVLRNPHAEELWGVVEPELSGRTDLREIDPPPFDTGDVPWWDPAADEAVRPEVDAVMINGVSVSKGSLVRVHPSRRADAQDLFFLDQVARVTAVLCDVDGDVHVALVLIDDPAADLHEWYGRYFYFAPDELEPLPLDSARINANHREESQP